MGDLEERFAHAAGAGPTPRVSGGGRSAVAPPVNSLTLDFLAWVASRPRTYAEAMEAWRTSCPRFTIWEDAIADDLVRLERGDGARLSESTVVLTPRGQSVLDGGSSGASVTGANVLSQMVSVGVVPRINDQPNP